MNTVASPLAIAQTLTELWSPRVIAELDDCYVKVAKVKGPLASVRVALGMPVADVTAHRCDNFIKSLVGGEGCNDV